MRAPAGQVPHQPAVDGAKDQFALLGPRPRAFDIVENPGQLGAGEIGIEQQPGARGHHLLETFRSEIGTDFGGAPVLPDDGVIDRFAGLTVPDDGGLALVGDADGGDLAGGLDRLAAGRQRGVPEVLRIVFNPAALRKMLGELLLRRGHERQGVIKHHGAGRGGALIDGKDMGHSVASLFGAFPRVVRSFPWVLARGFFRIADIRPSLSPAPAFVSAHSGASGQRNSARPSRSAPFFSARAHAVISAGAPRSWRQRTWRWPDRIRPPPRCLRESPRRRGSRR